MQYASYKERVIRIASHLFVQKGGMTESQVESILRNSLNPRLFDEPTLRPDHIRVGLVELGLLQRESDGTLYCVDLDRFVAKSNIQGIFGQHYPYERIKGVEHMLKKVTAFAERQDLMATD